MGREPPARESIGGGLFGTGSLRSGFSMKKSQPTRFGLAYMLPWGRVPRHSSISLPASGVSGRASPITTALVNERSTRDD